MFINRDWKRVSEHDDYVLNVEPYLLWDSLKESIELRDDNGTVVGWFIKPRYE